MNQEARSKKHESGEKLILDRDASVLRQIAKPVAPEDIGSKKINAILERMKTALGREEDGVAIAAPQIGESLRIFLISKNRTSLTTRSKVDEYLVFINPVINKLSRKKKRMEEGCLSLRWLYGQVERSEKATIRALDDRGKTFQMGASGLLAQIFQHEVDHLDGILFIDKAENVENIPPKENHGE